MVAATHQSAKHFSYVVGLAITAIHVSVSLVLLILARRKGYERKHLIALFASGLLGGILCFTVLNRQIGLVNGKGEIQVSDAKAENGEIHKFSDSLKFTLRRLLGVDTGDTKLKREAFKFDWIQFSFEFVERLFLWGYAVLFGLEKLLEKLLEQVQKKKGV